MRPPYDTPVGRQQYNYPKNNPVQCKSGEVVSGDITQESAYSHQGADERHDKTDCKAPCHAGIEYFPMTEQIIDRRNSEGRDGEEKGKLSSRPAGQAKEKTADDRGARS